MQKPEPGSEMREKDSACACVRVCECVFCSKPPRRASDTPSEQQTVCGKHEHTAPTRGRPHPLFLPFHPPARPLQLSSAAWLDSGPSFYPPHPAAVMLLKTFHFPQYPSLLHFLLLLIHSCFYFYFIFSYFFFISRFYFLNPSPLLDGRMAQPLRGAGTLQLCTLSPRASESTSCLKSLPLFPFPSTLPFNNVCPASCKS